MRTAMTQATDRNGKYIARKPLHTPSACPLYIGGVWYQQNQHFLAPNSVVQFAQSADFSISDSNAIFGFHAGAQWQWGVWVLGVEAALSGCTSECRSFSGVNTSPIFGPTQFAEHKMTNLFTLGPRLGWAVDRWMLFVTGGWASANLKSSICSTITGNCDGPGSQGNGASRNSGYYIGGGFDYMVLSTRGRWSTCSSASSISTTT